MRYGEIFVSDASNSNIDKIEKWFDSFLNFEKLPQKNMFWLDTVKFMCRKLGDPQDESPCVHIAGSKGKGSVSAMISSILEEAGYRTGLYTSPHILEFTERIGSAHGKFENEVYEAAFDELKNLMSTITGGNVSGSGGHIARAGNSVNLRDSFGTVTKRPVTWFELVTVYAFLCFKHAHTNFNVFEVGMGGRLDATNVIVPDLCVLTPIELEHTQFLGDTIEKIAGEKAGIIKDKIPVISADQNIEAENVFRKKASEKCAPLKFVSEMMDKSKCGFSYLTGENCVSAAGFEPKCIKEYTSLQTFYGTMPSDPAPAASIPASSIAVHSALAPSPVKTVRMNIRMESPLFSRPISAALQLLGRVQLENAKLAACAIKTLFPLIDESIIERGLEKAKLPGRFEIAKEDLVLDGAHTVNSIGFTVDTFNSVFKQRRAHLLFACAADKNVFDIALVFKNRFEKITLTRPGNAKKSDLSRMSEAFTKAGLKFTENEDHVSAIKNALYEAKKDGAVLLVTGSFYLVAEVKKIIDNLD
ncbi:bifunctional folylpolyglutamate synthase/dihydrofolate synthase [Treponema parvum]|uniref:Dihydrofolate synthase/folylpolyglutamate synthase n=1 Tax=Treponema parvum TaxID=138851 RepID=A0A975ICK3_9SPIR|nr:bifunctional folylpolyglutamate synthase/dihydrofolate synthase [Treponema parvum]